MSKQNTLASIFTVALISTLCACGPSERDKELERYKELMKVGDKWGQELRGKASSSQEPFGEACASKLTAGEPSSVVGYVAEMAAAKTAKTFAYPQKTAVVCSSYNLIPENIERASKNKDEHLEKLGALRYVVVTTEREVQMPPYIDPNKGDLPAGDRHMGEGSFATLYVGVYDWQDKKLLCSGHARADMPEEFTTFGMGRGQKAAEKEANTARAVSIGAISALSAEIQHIGIRKICNQISSSLCEASKRSKP